MRVALDRERALFYGFLALVVLLLWVPEYPPMVDMPQHAGQVFQLKQLLFSESRWHDQVQVNALTPYWIGYGLWLALSLVFSVKVALKVLVTLCLIAYVASFGALRREFAAPRILDWVLVPTFFGYAYEWGMITFLLALPVGLLFFLVNIYWHRNGGWRLGAVVLFTGIALFFSHGLVFVFFLFCSSLFLLVKSGFNVLVALRFAWPYVLLSALTLLYMARPDPLAAHYSYGESSVVWGSMADRLHGLFYMPWGIVPRGASTYVLSLLVMVFPFIMGMRLTRDGSRYVFAGSALLAFLVLPHFVSNTFLLYQRFSILLLPAYMLCFDGVESGPGQPGRSRHNHLQLLWGGLVVALMYNPAANLLFFNKETASFKALMAAVPEGKRALSWVYDRESRVVSVPSVYLHFPVWYQVERGGWVDYNFSWFHPQVVRFSPDSLPEVRPGFEWRQDLPALLEECARYELVFLHSFTVPPDEVLKETSCPHVPYMQAGNWYVYALPGVEEENSNVKARL